MSFAAQEIRRALESGEFVPFFQPIVDLRSQRLSGFEVLARWNHMARGLLPSDDFIADVERHGLINDLSVSLLRDAFAAVREIPRHLRLSVNLSPAQLHDQTIPDLVRRAAGEGAFELTRLTVELTEAALIHDLDLAGMLASKLKDAGIRLALDDFGTGYSSLLHLQSLPFDELKLDKSFVRQWCNRGRAAR